MTSSHLHTHLHVPTRHGTRAHSPFFALIMQSTPLELSSAGGDQTISLLNPLDGGDTAVTLEIEEVFTHALSPFPVEIAQGESQKVRNKGSRSSLSFRNFELCDDIFTKMEHPMSSCLPSLTGSCKSSISAQYPTFSATTLCSFLQGYLQRQLTSPRSLHDGLFNDRNQIRLEQD